MSCHCVHRRDADKKVVEMLQIETVVLLLTEQTQPLAVLIKNADQHHLENFFVFLHRAPLYFAQNKLK